MAYHSNKIALSLHPSTPKIRNQPQFHYSKTPKCYISQKQLDISKLKNRRFFSVSPCLQHSYPLGYKQKHLRKQRHWRGERWTCFVRGNIRCSINIFLFVIQCHLYWNFLFIFKTIYLKIELLKQPAKFGCGCIG